MPGVLYGGDKQPVAIAVRANEFRKALYTGKLLGHLVTLKHGGETQSVIAKDVQMHPVTDEPWHFDLFRVERQETDRIKNVAVLGVNTFGWTFVNRGEEVPAPKPYIRLTAPSGAIWEWNDPSDDERIEGSGLEFCQVVTQTRSIGDTSLSVTGPVATKWMAVAQCFAGPVNPPPTPGTRHMAAG